jgi:hypothetical protein
MLVIAMIMVMIMAVVMVVVVCRHVKYPADMAPVACGPLWPRYVDHAIMPHCYPLGHH